MRLLSLDRDQRQRFGLAADCMTLLQVPQRLTQTFDAATLRAHDPGILELK